MKTAVLLAALGALFMLIGGAIGGATGLVIGLGIGLIFVGGSYWLSDTLAIKAAGAQLVSREQLPQVYATVEQLTQQSGMPMPRVYISPAMQPNAFATGRSPDHAAVVVTQGILQVLDDDELRGVLAHELSHVKNRDILIGSVAAAVAMGITLVARMAMWGALFGGGGDRDGGNAFGAIAMMILAPIAAAMLQMSLSRSREYQADATGAHFTGNPYALASALQKIDAYSKRVPLQANPSTAHLFIIQPFLGVNAGMFANLFSTHPPVAKRIERLTGRPADTASSL
jgi:heat shock protein HtpX